MSRFDVYDSLAWWRSLPPMYGTFEELKVLPEYSATNPTGVTLGKTWRRHDGVYDCEFLARGGTPRWVICRYEEAEPEVIRGKLTEMCATVSYRAVIRVKAKSIRIENQGSMLSHA